MADHVFSMEEVLRILNPIVGKTLGEVDRNNVFNKTEKKPKITGIAGDVIEQSVFGYPADVKQEADLLIDGRPVELKTTGLKRVSSRNKSGYAIEAKEPMSITAVSLDKIAQQDDFYDSTLWHKLEELLLVYYLYDSDKTVPASEYFHFPIQGFQFFKFSEEDQVILENDWKIVRDFVKKVEKKNLNKQEEFPKISKLRTEMSFMDTAPKFPNSPRFRLTKNYVTTIVQEHFGKEFQPLLPDKKFSNLSELKRILSNLSKEFTGKTIKEIADFLDVRIELSKNGKVSKSISSRILAKMFSNQANKIEDIMLFHKFGFKSKTIVLTDKNKRTEDTKLLMVDFDEWLDNDIEFEFTSIRDYFSEQRFLFSVFREGSTGLYEDNIFLGFKIISFDDDFIEREVKPVWEQVRYLIKNNKLELVIEKDKNGMPKVNNNGIIIEAPNFPKSRDYDVFLRGSGKDSTAKPLEINGLKMYYQFVWIKGSYLAEMLNATEFL